MKCWISVLTITLVLVSGHAKAQSTSKKNIVGFEVDALPYITGGYYGSVWLARNHFRYRAIIAKVKIPNFLVEDGFTNNVIQAYAFIADYFWRPDITRWWVGGGFEYWRGRVQTDTMIETAHYDNLIFTLGGGYVWKFYKNFYLNPWAAGHVRVAGDTKVPVDNKEFTPRLFTPEISVKIGWHF